MLIELYNQAKTRYQIMYCITFEKKNSNYSSKKSSLKISLQENNFHNSHKAMKQKRKLVCKSKLQQTQSTSQSALKKSLVCFSDYVSLIH